MTSPAQNPMSPGPSVSTSQTYYNPYAQPTMPRYPLNTPQQAHFPPTAPYAADDPGQQPFHPYSPHPQGPIPQQAMQSQQQDFLPPLHKEPPTIKFNGKTYAILPEIYTKSNIPDPSIAKQFTDLIVIVLKYGIPALEAKLKTKITSLNNLKIIKEVDGEEPGKLKLQYTIKGKKEPQEVAINDSFELSKQEQNDICVLLETQSNCKGCHTDHNTVKKIYERATELLTKTRSYQDNEAKPPYTTALIPLTYNCLPESFKKDHPHEEANAKDATKTEELSEEEASKKPLQTKKTNAKIPLDQSSSPKPQEQLGGLVKLRDNKKINYTLEELKEDNIPLIEDADTSKDFPETRWKDYLLNGILRQSSPTGEKAIERSIKPIIFTSEKAVDILRKMKTKAKENKDFSNALEFSKEEQVFIKRLLLLIKKSKEDAAFDLHKGDAAFLHILLGTFNCYFEALVEYAPANLAENHQLIDIIKIYLEKVPNFQ